MDFGSKLEELNLTRDEMSRLGEALKDEQFRELLREYTAEISSPENRRRREEELALLEEQRGVSARFLHPEPHHVLKTRGARGKLFINICSDPLIDKPSSEAARDRDGTPGHRWRIPFSLTPGTPDRDAAGNSCVTHDVIFHPDALRLAGNSRRFMKLLHSTAIGGIEDSFHVTLEKHNIKQLKMKYKGVPQETLIRRPIPGHQQNTCEDLLPFPDPDQTRREPDPDQTQREPEPDQTQPEPDQTQREPDPDQTQREPEPDPDQTRREPDPDPDQTRREPDPDQTEPDQSHTEPEPDQTQEEPDPDQSHTEPEPDPDQTHTEPEPDPDQTQREPDPDQIHTEPEPDPDQTQTEPDQTQTEPDLDQSHTEPDPDQIHTEPDPDQTQREPDPDQIHTEPDPDQTHTEPEPDQIHIEPDSSPSSHQPPAPQYSVKYRSVVDLQDYRISRDSGPGARPTEIIITVELPLLGSAGDAELSVKQRRLVLESQNPEYKLDLPLSYPVDEDKGHAKFNRTKHQLTVTLPVRPAPSTGSQRVRPDEMKSSDEEEEEDEADPEPKEDCSTLTRSLQPSASEPQTTALTTEPQTLSDPAVNRTEPQTLSDPAVNWTEPQTLSDPAVNRTEPQMLSDPAVNRTEPQSLSDPAVNRTEPQTLSDPAVNRTEPQTLSDPAVNRTEPQTLSDPAVNRTEPQTLSDPAVNRTEPQTLSDPAVNRTEPLTLSDPAVNRTEPQTLSDPAVNRTEPQTLSDPAVNRTEPQEPDHQICSVETDKDEPNINQPVDRSSNTFSSESEIPANGDEVSGAPETENTQESESNTALSPHQPLTTDNNTPINHSSSTHEDPSSSQDTEEPQTRRSSEDQESTAEVILREMEPDGRHVSICFQNSLWSDLD